MDERDDALRDPFGVEPPPAAGRLVWGAMAAAVAFAGLAVTVAIRGLEPAQEIGAALAEPRAPAQAVEPAPAPLAAVLPTAHVGARDDDAREPSADPALLALVAGLPESWRAGVPLVLPGAVVRAEASPWVLPEMPTPPELAGLAKPAPAASAHTPAAEPEPALAARSEPPPPRPPAGALPQPAPAVLRAAPDRRGAAAKPATPGGEEGLPASAVRCREAVIAAQIGQQPSRADIALMRSGCSG